MCGWVGQMKECCSFTTSCRNFSRADTCPGSVGHIHLQGQASQKDAVGMMLHCSKSGMTCLSLKTNTGSSKSQSERESDPLPPSVFEDATATPVKLCLNIFGFPAEPVTLLCTVFPFSLF